MKLGGWLFAMRNIALPIEKELFKSKDVVQAWEKRKSITTIGFGVTSILVAFTSILMWAGLDSAAVGPMFFIFIDLCVSILDYFSEDPCINAYELSCR